MINYKIFDHSKKLGVILFHFVYFQGRSLVAQAILATSKVQRDIKSHISEKTCFQNKSKFITEDNFVQHMNITTNQSLINLNYIQKIVKGPA